jgi:hypothetical protein
LPSDLPTGNAGISCWSCFSGRPRKYPIAAGGRDIEIAESRPEMVARHCTEAGQIEKAAASIHQPEPVSIPPSMLI